MEFGQDGLGELLTELDSPLVPDDVPLFQLRRVEWFKGFVDQDRVAELGAAFRGESQG